MTIPANIKLIAQVSDIGPSWSSCYICRDRRFVTIPANIKLILLQTVFINRLMSILFSFQSRKFIKLNINSFGAKFQTTLVCFSFFLNKLSLEKKFIRKVEILNVKQRRSR